MPKTKLLDLKGMVPGDSGIEFLGAEVPEDRGVPFALIHYALDSQKQAYGLRLDLDKRVFLDHFEDDEEREAVLIRSAPIIVKVLGSILYPG